jgi:hypothetical protein
MVEEETDDLIFYRLISYPLHQQNLWLLECNLAGVVCTSWNI